MIRPSWQAFLRGLRTRINGKTDGEHFTHLNTRATVPVNPQLEKAIATAHRKPLPVVERVTPESPFLQRLRQAMQDDLIGERKLIEEQPDTFKRPINYDDGLPNG